MVVPRRWKVRIAVSIVLIASIRNIYQSTQTHSTSTRTSQISTRPLQAGVNLVVKSEKKEKIDINYENYNVSILPVGTHEFSSNNILFHGQSICGSNKCFFRLKKTVNSVYDTGYIVEQAYGMEIQNKINKFQKTWNLAIDLEKEYNISTLIIAPPPRVLPANETHTNILMEGLRNGTKSRPLEFNKFLTVQKMPRIPLKDNKFSIVQKMKVSPERSILWHKAHDEEFVQDFHRVKKYIIEFVRLNVKGREVFCDNLFRNLNVLKRILDNPKYNCLARDLQMIMDYEGTFHHIDLDRCFLTRKYTQPKQFFKKLESAFVHAFQDMNVNCSMTYMFQLKNRKKDNKNREKNIKNRKKHNYKRRHKREN